MILEYCKNNRSRLSFIAITFFTLMFIQVKYSHSYESLEITGTWTGMLIIKKGQEHCHYKVTTVIGQSNDYIKSWQGTSKERYTMQDPNQRGFSKKKMAQNTAGPAP